MDAQLDEVCGVKGVNYFLHGDSGNYRRHHFNILIQGEAFQAFSEQKRSE